MKDKEFFCDRCQEWRPLGCPHPHDRRLDSPAYDPPPKHYDSGRGLDLWQVWDAFGLDCDAYLANVVKYVLRAGKKGPKMPDLIKARNYLNKAIEREAER